VVVDVTLGGSRIGGPGMLASATRRPV
jgi:hypothetical protein